MPQVPRYLNTSGPNYIYADTGEFHRIIDNRHLLIKCEDDYNYDASQAFELSSYPIGRFATEFGFHSMPSVYSWEQAVPADQLSFFSDMVIHRNRHYPFGGPANATNRELSILGLEEMTTAVQEWYPIPNMKDSVANFTFVYKYIIVKMYANKTAVHGVGQPKSSRQTIILPNWPSTAEDLGCRNATWGHCTGNWKIYGKYPPINLYYKL